MAKWADALPGRLGQGASLSFILIIVLSMAFSGWFALYEGLFRFTLPFTSADATAQVSQAIAAVRLDPTADRIAQVSQELRALAQLSSVQRFADSRIPEQGLYYTLMPRANQALLLVHVLFGAFCMLLGGLQFWPAFRRRYMRAHRLIGLIYVVTVPISVLTAFAYMALTPPHHIYAHLVAWIALWVFGALAMLAITMALLALKARRIYEHQAWMALSFGCLMVAPLLRLDWVLLAWLFPHIDQETLNLVTMGVMLPEVLLIAYGLILVNRQYARPMVKRSRVLIAEQAAALFNRLLPALLLLSLALLGVNLMFLVLGQGMSALAASASLVPAALLASEQAVLAAHPIISAVLALSLSLAFPLAALQLNSLLLQREAPSFIRRATPWLALAAGLSACFIGTGIGLAPAKALLSGGTLYMVNGLVLSAFSLFLLATQARGQRALVKESLVFLLCLLPFPTLFVLSLQVMSWLPLPADYIAAGQGFVVPVGFSAGLMFLALLYVVYGQATREHN